MVTPTSPLAASPKPAANWRYPEGGIIPLPYHHTMLADRNRCEAFQRAIAREVSPGSVVFEAGAGTGILSYFAAQRATKVYAVEADPEVARLGSAVVAANGLSDRVDYQAGTAEALVPAEPVDVVICEMLHVALAVEQQVPVMNAIHRQLKARHPAHPYKVIPEAAVNYCQLVQADFGFYGYQAPFVRFGSPYIPDPSIVPLSPLVPYARAAFDAPMDEHIAARCRLEADHVGEVNAVRLLTQAVLSLDSALPADQALIDWYLHFLVVPLPASWAVEPGAAFNLDIEYDAGCPLDEIALRVCPAHLI